MHGCRVFGTSPDATADYTGIHPGAPVALAFGEERRGLTTRELERFRGREVDTSEDTVLAGFDGPARAVRCACSIRDAVSQLGIEIRAGLHSGEIELAGDDIGGIAVHIASRVIAASQPGEVLVSSTVKDLSAGSGIVFHDRGKQVLKGMPDEWQLFAVV